MATSLPVRDSISRRMVVPYASPVSRTIASRTICSNSPSASAI